MKYHAELKNCPFCGGESILEYNHRAFINGQTTKVSFVRCKVCNARSGRFKLTDFGCTSHSKEANEKAVDAWNKRDNAVEVVRCKDCAYFMEFTKEHAEKMNADGDCFIRKRKSVDNDFHRCKNHDFCSWGVHRE